MSPDHAFHHRICLQKGPDCQPAWFLQSNDESFNPGPTVSFRKRGLSVRTPTFPLHRK